MDSNQISKTNNVGGAGNTATPGGYNQGNAIAGSGNYSRGIGEQKDLRGGTSVSTTGYNQGDAFAATKGKEPLKSVKVSQPDLRGGNSNPNTGYNQGAQK